MLWEHEPTGECFNARSRLLRIIQILTRHGEIVLYFFQKTLREKESKITRFSQYLIRKFSFSRWIIASTARGSSSNSVLLSSYGSTTLTARSFAGLFCNLFEKQT